MHHLENFPFVEQMNWCDLEPDPSKFKVSFKGRLTDTSATLQTHHVYSTLKRRGNGRIHVVSTWNTRGVFVGEIRVLQSTKDLTRFCSVLVNLLATENQFWKFYITNFRHCLKSRDVVSHTAKIRFRLRILFHVETLLLRILNPTVFYTNIT